mmetsp:Transcript_55293/g.81253  ORF Transcript_55293/g.81253 Transcript_55293/m.81253 type:complete len:93 (+) Transcript_55293:217-495(+)
MKDREMQHLMQMAAAQQESKVSAQNVRVRCPHKMQERPKKFFSSMRRGTGHLRLKLVTFCCENMCTSDSYSLVIELWSFNKKHVHLKLIFNC